MPDKSTQSWIYLTTIECGCFPEKGFLSLCPQIGWKDWNQLSVNIFHFVKTDCISLNTVHKHVF